MGALQSTKSYATPEDFFSCGAPTKAFIKCQPSEILRALQQASRIIDAHISTRYQDLATWDDDLTQWCCQIALYRLCTFRGWNPADINNAGIVTLYREAMDCLRRVQNGTLTLNVTTTSPEPTYQPDVATSPMRGI